MPIKKFADKCTGFTLVEMLVALVINVVVLLALLAVFSSNIGNVNQVNDIDILNQQLQSALQLMTNDIRRAGYWGNAKSNIGAGSNNNPFMTVLSDVMVNGAKNCILFTYDYNSDGFIPIISFSGDDEHYGYQLSNQTLQTRPPGTLYACGATGWENITDPKIMLITALVFTLNTNTVPSGAAHDTIVIRSVDISITGQLTSNSAVTKTLTQHVRIENDKYVP